MRPRQDGGVEVFSRLMTGLEAQLGGMGVAFSSSLLGLAGSLIVGLLELFAGHGQNRFYRELEEWLSSFTRVSFASGEGEAGMDQNALAAMVDHMSQQMEALQAMFVQADAGRAELDDKLGRLADGVMTLAARMEAGDPGVAKMAEQQGAILERIAEASGVTATEADAESRMRLRSIDVQMLRILEEMSAGRQEAIADLRTDLAVLTRAIRQIAPPTGAAASPVQPRGPMAGKS